MKKLLSIAVFLISLSASAQGNLQFNQVVNLNYTHTIPSGYSNSTVTTITVPVGKIWKIEYSSLSLNNASYRFTGVMAQSLSIDNFVLIAQNGSGNFERQKGGVLWLNEGDHNLLITQETSNTNDSFDIGISAIEFNIVP